MHSPSILLIYRWAMNNVEFFEHLGTHIDAPYHGAANGQKMHEIPVERLIGPGVVIDVKEKVKINPNYAVSVEDLLNYEATYGRIPPNAVVMMNSGWGLKYPNPKEVFGTEQPENVSTFSFPGFHLDACKFLLDQRQVGSVGVDTPSTDPGHLNGYPCHRYLLPNQIPLIEYVAHLDTIPCNETTIILGAIKHRGGTGGPTRVLALLREEGDDPTGGAVKMTQGILGCFAVVLLSVGTMFYTN